MLAAERYQALAGFESRRRVPPHHVNEARQPLRMSDTRRVAKIGGNGDTAAQACQRLIGIAQHPQRNGALPATADRRVVSAIEQGVRAVLLAVVKGEALVHMV